MIRKKNTIVIMSAADVLILVICLLILSVGHATEHLGIESLLTEKLLSNYGPTAVRPVRDVGKQVEVHIKYQLHRVIELEERTQTLKQSSILKMSWHDDYMEWNTTMYPKVQSLIVPNDKIWKPDIYLIQNVHKDFESFKDVGLLVYPDGTVEWVVPAILYTFCRIDATKFPFDTQYCIFGFASWAYSLNQLKPTPENSSVGKHFTENGIWKLVDVRFEIKNDVYEEHFPYQEVYYTVVLQRSPLYHIFNLILPCLLLSILNLLVFLLPTESGEKISLGITNLLALVLFQQLVADTLPPSSQDMPVISYYFAPMILIGCLSIVSGVIVAGLHHQHKSRSIPSWLRTLTRVPMSTTSVSSSPDITQRNEVYDFRKDWRHVATAIDHMLLALGLVVTVIAVAIMAIVFAT